MQVRFAAMALLLLPVVSAASAGESAAAPESRQFRKTLDTTVPVNLDYLLYLPKNYEQRNDWPLVLFLHGAGERGDNLQRVETHGPPKRIAAGQDFPFILVAPQCPKERWWEPFELLALLEKIVEVHNVDEDRVYLTGLSMGGHGSWDLATYAPERFAAVAPICGGGIPYRTERIVGTPVWAFHGAEDPVVPVERTKEMVAALRKAGGDPKLTIYPEAGHDSWTETYENPKFYEWLLKQRRNGE